MLNARLGDTVSITVLRNGQTVEVSMTVTAAHITEY
jgi:S1-C subfamily serine protease